MSAPSAKATRFESAKRVLSIGISVVASRAVSTRASASMGILRRLVGGVAVGCARATQRVRHPVIALLARVFEPHPLDPHERVFRGPRVIPKARVLDREP